MIFRRRAFWLVLAAGLAVRGLLAVSFFGSSDLRIWEFFSGFLAEGRVPYEDFRFNYGTPWFLILSAVGSLARWTGWPFALLLKALLILFDALIYWTVVSFFPKDERAALRAGATYFLSPVAILVSSFGQFDNISAWLALLACLAAAGLTGAPGWRSALWLSLAVCVKHFNVMIAPVFALRHRPVIQRVLFLAAPPVLFVLFLAPYLPEYGPLIRRNLFDYNLHGGYWGWSGILCRLALFFFHYDATAQPWFSLIDSFNALLYLFIFGVSFVLVKRYDLIDSVVVVFLIFYVLTTQMSPQYTVWILPFAALRPNRYVWAYSILGGAQIAAFYYCNYHWKLELPMEGFWASKASEAFVIFRHLTWLACVAWLWARLRRAQ